MADEDILFPEQIVDCEYCDPTTSRPAFVTLNADAPVFYARELNEPDEDGFRMCSFSDVAARRIGAWLAKQAMKFWPNGTLIVEDVHLKSFWIVRLAESDVQLAFEQCVQTPCCKRYVIGAETFPWQYDPAFSLEMALEAEPW